jgi:hypothetical protein
MLLIDFDDYDTGAAYSACSWISGYTTTATTCVSRSIIAGLIVSIFTICTTSFLRSG